MVLDQLVSTIGRQRIECLLRAVRPLDIDLNGALVIAQSKVQARTIMALVAASGVDLGNPRLVAETDADFGSHGIAIANATHQRQLDPMPTPSGIVANQGRRGIGVEHDQVQIAVVVQVIGPGSSADFANLHT
jgi:hypothetical protein